MSYLLDIKEIIC